MDTHTAHAPQVLRIDLFLWGGGEKPDLEVFGSKCVLSKVTATSRCHKTRFIF